MKLFLVSGVLILAIYLISPNAFNAISDVIDTPRCAIGMESYCDRAPTPDFRNFDK